MTWFCLWYLLENVVIVHVHVCILCSKEDVREAGKIGLIPQVGVDEGVKVELIPMFPDVVGYLHKRVSYVYM